MSTMPRWPELFPSMKERGGRRRAGKRKSQERTKLMASIKEVGETMQRINWDELFGELGKAITRVAGEMQEFVTSFMSVAPQSSYALSGPVLDHAEPKEPEEHDDDIIMRAIQESDAQEDAELLEALLQEECTACGALDGDHATSCRWYEWDESDPWDARPNTGCSTCDGGGCGDCA